jgi:hypothetical protein
MGGIRHQPASSGLGWIQIGELVLAFAGLFLLDGVDSVAVELLDVVAEMVHRGL